MPDRLSRVSSLAQDRAAHWTIVVTLSALAALSEVTRWKHKLCR